MNVFITGGAGYIGTILTNKLLFDGDQVKVLDSLVFGGQHILANLYSPGFELVHGSIAGVTRKMVTDCDVVVHLAAITFTHGDYMERQIMDVNFECTKRLVDLCKKEKKHLIFSSTCHDKDTRLVTKRGIIPYTEIKKDDIVFSLNPDSLFLEEVPINEIICKKYSGELIKIKTRRIELAVTPDHTILYVTETGKILKKTALEMSKNKAYRIFPKFNGFIGKDENKKIKIFDVKDFFLLTGMFIGDGFLTHTTIRRNRKSGVNRKEYFNKCRDKKNGRFINSSGMGDIVDYYYEYIQFAIGKNDRGRKELTDVLKKYKIRYRDEDDRVTIQGRKDLNELFKPCGIGAHNKKIPKWMLNYSSDVLIHLFDGLMLTDGAKTGYTYTTVSEELKNNFVELCFKVGKIPKVRKKENSKNLFEGREICGKVCYIIMISKTNPQVLKRNYSVEKYDDIVWCLNVKNHNFLIERNSSFAISGNCSNYGESGFATEESPLFPTNAYARSKTEAEKYIQENLPSATILRFATVFGLSPRMRFDTTVNEFVLKAVSTGYLSVYNYDAWRPYIHIDDVTDAVLFFLQNKEVSGVYNVGDDRLNISKRMLCETLQEYIPNLHIELQTTVNDPRNYKVSFDKVNEAGFKTKKSLRAGINEVKSALDRKVFLNPQSDIYDNFKTYQKYYSAEV